MEARRDGARGRYLADLDLRGFRGLASGLVVLDPGLTLVTGRNGQGKTNLLEAAYLLTTSKSFRSAHPREMIRFGEAEAIVAGTVTGPTAERLAVRLSLHPAARKELFRGGRPVTASAFLGALRPVAFTAETRALVGGAPEGRRVFLDRGMAAARPEHLAALAQFRRAHRQKLRLLDRRAGRAELAAWNVEVARRGAAVALGRKTWIEELKKKCRRSVSASSGTCPRWDSSTCPRPPTWPGRRAWRSRRPSWPRSSSGSWSRKRAPGGRWSVRSGTTSG